MLICGNCGLLFLDEAAIYRREKYGECHGIPAEQAVKCCPRCHSDDVGEPGRCAVCGKLKYTNDLNSAGVCPCCMEEPEESLYLVLKKYAQAKRELRRFESRCLALECGHE